MATPQSIVPTLQIISGPFAGRLFTLERDVTIIGRNPECDMVLQPKSVSRKHAAIVRKDGGFLLRDLGSTRGTFVNGQKLTESGDAPGRQHDPDRRAAADLQQPAGADPGRDDEQSTVYAAIDVVNQSSSKNLPLVKPEVKLRALRLISQELGGTLVLTEVLDRIFNSLFEIFPRAERGFVLLQGAGRARPSCPRSIRSRTGPPGELTISKTVLNRVLNDGQAILSQGPGQGVPRERRASRRARSAR